MNKIIGLLTAWGAERWIRFAIEQALGCCDEVLAVVSPYTPELMPFEDATYDICKEYKGLRLLDYRTKEKTVSCAVADVLNHMLEKSVLRANGNWVWILDVDEFYADLASAWIRAIIKDDRYDQVSVESKFFMINTRHYLEEEGNRLFKIMNPEDCFMPTNRWSNLTKRVTWLPRGIGMFHYGMLASAEMYRMKWQVEYKDHVNKRQMDKVKWLDKIYANYDLTNEDRWTAENRKLFGLRSPWPNSGFKPDGNGRLFKFNNKHPKLIENAGFTEIEDFRRDGI